MTTTELEMEIKVTNIGKVTVPDGADEYLLLTRLDEDLTLYQAKDWLFERLYAAANNNIIGNKSYCHIAWAAHQEPSTSKVICIVEHRFDIQGEAA